MATVGGILQNVSPPPRDVPLALSVSAYLGGAGAQTAWLVLLLGLFPLWYVRYDTSICPSDVFAFWGATEQVKGTVTDLIEGKSQTVGFMGTDGAGYEHYLERVEILGVRYRYPARDGWYTGSAYGIKEHSREELYANIGATIPVEYVVADPSLSRVSNLRRENGAKMALVGWAYWGAIGLGGCALLTILHGLARGRTASRLLSIGVPGVAKLVDVEPVTFTPLVGLRRLTYRLSPSADGREGVIEDVSDGAGGVDLKLWSGRGDKELTPDDDPVFYDARNPAAALVLRHFPGHLEVDDQCRLTEGDFNPYRYLWLPALCVLGYLWFAMDLLDVSAPPWEVVL